MRRLTLFLLPLILVGMIIPLGTASADANERCFPETGYCISGVIRAYWERNGGLPVFGYPISPVNNETIEGTWTGPVQWFERDRLEDHSAQGMGVLAGRLGAQYLEMQGRPWTPGTPPARAGNGCQIFTQTGYEVCGLFLTYWKRNGGLMRFGYPITAQINEQIGDTSYTVQYFERRRMEFHPENPAPYNVLLGLLGREIMTRGCSVPVVDILSWNGYDRNTFGCPIPGQDYENVSGAWAHFERGEMYWIQLRGGRGVIYVVIYGANNTMRYQRFDDTWSEGQPINSGLTPPPGLREPSRGFGKVWREQPGIRDALGWAVEDERAVQMYYQAFDRGSMMAVMYNYGTSIWKFFADGRAERSE